MHSVPRASRARAGWARVAALALGLAILGAPLVASTQPARADEVGISTLPAGADGQPDGRTRFTYVADPGQHVKDAIFVANTGSAAQSFTVVSTDAFNDDEGDFALLQTAAEPTAAGTWVHFENGTNRLQFDLAPGQSRTVPFTFEVPADATPGDHVGGILASVVTPGSEVSLDRRVATRFYARVSGQLQPLLSVSSLSGEWNGDWWNPFTGTMTVRFVATNTGNISLAANSTTLVRTWFGISTGASANAVVKELLPGSSASFELTVPGVPQWGYLSPTVTLAPFVETQDTALAVTADPVSRDTFVFVPPWSLLILIALGVAAFFIVREVRRRGDARADEWIAYAQQQAEYAAQVAAAERDGARETETAGRS